MIKREVERPSWKLSGVFQNVCSVSCPRLVQLLAEWTETFPYGLPGREGDGPRQVHHAEGRCGRRCGSRQEVSALLQNLLLRLTALERYEEGSGQIGDRGNDRATLAGSYKRSEYTRALIIVKGTPSGISSLVSTAKKSPSSPSPFNRITQYQVLFLVVNF
ncbi:hypothetical protein K0M31_004704 [Melipona bicolor]|uniref:N-terminal Ras-GEF domain-containing protein n=1 Tax=Melipona bicolor TaxID=60889 RepID=A0AA40FY45_9HYME|nr:hypothetical protein K0M31_004704 [Melipona bicolor]